LRAPAHVARRVVLERKGKTLRTATTKKALITPSPTGLSGSLAAEYPVLDTVLLSLDDSKAENIVPIDIHGKSPLATAPRASRACRRPTGC
jgi:ribosome-associated protein